MRISDWSSDVCSSDLPVLGGGRGAQAMSRGAVVSLAPGPLLTRSSCRLRLHWHLLSDIVARALNPDPTAGRTPDEHMRSPPHLVARWSPLVHGLKDRTSGVEGKGVSVRVDLGGR